MDKQQEYVLRTIEERDVRFIRLWFTDVLGTLKSVAIAPAELEQAFAEGIGFDGSAIEGLTRVYEADMLVKPDPGTFQILPWRGEENSVARMFCDVLTPTGEPARSDPRNVLKRALDKAADAGFTFYTHPEIEFYLFERPQNPEDPLVPIDTAGYFDHVAARHRAGLPPRRHHDPGVDGHLGGVLPPRGRPGPERDRPALRRRPEHGRQHPDLPHGGQGGRAAAGRARHLHAQAADGRARLGHAHPPVPLRGRPQRLLRPGGAVPALRHRPRLHRGPAAPRRGDHRGDQPVRQLLQAAVGRRGGPELRVLGPQQPLGARPGADVQAGEGRLGAGRVPRPGLRGQPLPRLRGAAQPPASRASRRATSCPRAPTTTSSP